MSFIRAFGPDGVCSTNIEIVEPEIKCDPLVEKVCVNPITNTIMVYYNDGTFQDSGQLPKCPTDCCYSAGKICSPKYPNSTAYDII